MVNTSMATVQGAFSLYLYQFISIIKTANPMTKEHWKALLISDILPVINYL